LGDSAVDAQVVAGAQEDLRVGTETAGILPGGKGEDKLQLDYCQEGTVGQEE